jgi:spore coat protein A
LKEVRDEYGRLRPSLGTVTGGAMMWMDSTTENIKLNDTEEWEIYNETSDAHPIHLHSISMQLVNRQFYKADQFDMSTMMMRMNNQSPIPGNMKHAPGVSMSMMSIANTNSGNLVLPTTTTGMPMNEGILTNIQMLGMPMMPSPDELGWKDTWVIYPGQVMRVRAKFDLPGNYVWHCHILSHEDHDMMRPMTIVPNNLPVPPDSTANFIKKIQLIVMPNPFSTKATIQFKLKETSPVSIVLYNSQGKVVKTIFSGTLKPGSQYFYVNASDTKVTGTYPVQIVVGKERASVNLVYVK